MTAKIKSYVLGPGMDKRNGYKVQAKPLRTRLRAVSLFSVVR